VAALRVNGIRAAFEGRVGFDPELRYTQAGKALLNVSVGVSDGKGGVEWVRATLWEALAEEMHEQLEKGVHVYVEGRLTLGQWTGQDGQQRSGLNVSAWTCEILGAIGRREPRRVDQDAGDAPVVDPADAPAYRQRIAAAAAEGAVRAASRSRWGHR
jgi:single-strand DNA-binding protein